MARMSDKILYDGLAVVSLMDNYNQNTIINAIHVVIQMNLLNW
jgi:hypothetical protein